MNTQLTDKQVSTLLSFMVVVNEASSDLDDSLSNGYMSDSKHTVASLANDDLREGLPDEIAARLKEFAKVAWSSVSGGHDAYRRAGETIFNVGQLRRYIDDLLANHKENSETITCDIQEADSEEAVLIVGDDKQFETTLDDVLYRVNEGELLLVSAKLKSVDDGEIFELTRLPSATVNESNTIEHTNDNALDKDAATAFLISVDVRGMDFLNIISMFNKGSVSLKNIKNAYRHKTTNQ